MERAVLNLGLETLGRSNADVVHSHFTVQVDAVTFPNPEWRDFSVVLLGWWCRGLLRLLQGESAPIEIHFMEGPYSAELGPIQNNVVRLILVERGLERRVIYNGNVELRPLAKSVSTAADQITRECKRRNWASKDLEALARLAVELRQELASALH